jgi:hypothetical protein
MSVCGQNLELGNKHDTHGDDSEDTYADLYAEDTYADRGYFTRGKRRSDKVFLLLLCVCVCVCICVFECVCL